MGEIYGFRRPADGRTQGFNGQDERMAADIEQGRLSDAEWQGSTSRLGMTRLSLAPEN